MEDIKPKKNLNIQNASIPKEKDLPGTHSPTIPLPSITPKGVTETKKVDVVKKVPQKLVKKEIASSKKKPIKPVEVELPGKDSPDLAETVSVWPKTGEAKAKEDNITAPVSPIPAVGNLGNISDAEPTLETGPVEIKVPINWKKILMFGGVIIIILVILVTGYFLVKRLTAPKTVVTPEVVVPEEIIVKEEVKIDEYSLDFLKNYYKNIEDSVSVLEQDVSFEETLDLSKSKL